MAIPKPALILGAAGLLPFLAAAVEAHLGLVLTPAWAVQAGLYYGVAILSFMGRAQWGLAMAHGPSLARLGLSVVPALLGWAALLIPVQAGLLLVSAGFAGALMVDLTAARRGWAPAWYPMLRLPLTAVVVVCLFVTGLARV